MQANCESKVPDDGFGSENVCPSARSVLRFHAKGYDGDEYASRNGFFEIRNFSVDHIVPKAKGGTDHLDNLQLLCSACNSTKGTKTQEEFLAILKRDGIRS